MAKTDFKSVDDYIATQPEAAQRVLRRVRGIIRKAVPGGEEVISYQIPAYKLNGRIVMYFAGWKEHFSLYPLDARIAARLRNELAGYETSKGTIKIPLSERVPVALIDGFARMRAKEAAEAHDKAKKKKKKKTKTMMTKKTSAEG